MLSVFSRSLVRQSGQYSVGNQCEKVLGNMNSSALKKYQLPKWILNWFYVTVVVCIWDASFILCRPHSLPGGAWNKFWYLCKYYNIIM